MSTEPHCDTAAELATLACVMRNEDSIDMVPELAPEHFFDIRCRKYYRAMLEVRAEKERIEIHSLYYKLKDESWAVMFPEEFNPYFGSCVSIVTHAKAIMDAHTKRSIVGACRAIKEVVSSKKDIQEIVSESQSLIKSIYCTGVVNGIEKLEDVISRVSTRIVNNEQAIEYLKTGIGAIDEKVSGVAKGKATFIAAPPSIGKSMFAANLIANFNSMGYKVLVFALEDLSDTLGVRMLSRAAQVDSRRLIGANLDMPEYERVYNAADKLSSTSIWVDDSVGATPEKIRAAAIKIKNEFGLDAVIVDHMTEMVNHEDEYGSTGSNATKLRDLAKELNIAMIPLHQLNRAPVKEKRRPMMSDLRGSGTIEAVARGIWFLHYPRLFDKLASEDSIELIIAKNTDGQKGIIDLQINHKFMFIGDIQNGEVEPGGY